MKASPWYRLETRGPVVAIALLLTAGCGTAFPPPPTRATSLPAPSNTLTSATLVPISLRVSGFAQLLSRLGRRRVLDSGWQSLSAQNGQFSDVRTFIATQVNAALWRRGFVPSQFQITAQRTPAGATTGPQGGVKLAFNERYSLTLRNAAGSYVCSPQTQTALTATALLAAQANPEGKVTATATNVARTLPAVCRRAGDALDRGIAIDLGPALNRYYARGLYALSDGVGNLLQEAADFAFRAKFAALSRVLARPIAVKDNLWLTPNVQNIAVRNLALAASGSDLLVNFNLAVAARPQISIGAQPPTLEAQVPRIGALDVPDGFYLPIDVRVPFDLLVAKAREKMVGYELPVKVIGTVRVTEVDLYATDAGTADAPKPQLVVEVGFTGGASGKLYLQGTPYIDPATRIVSMPDLNYTVQTRHLLIRAFAPLLTASFVVDRVRAAATYDAGPAIDEAVAPFMQAYQKTLTPDPNVTVTLSAFPGKPQLLGATNDAQALYVRVAATGTLQTHVDLRTDTRTLSATK